MGTRPDRPACPARQGCLLKSSGGFGPDRQTTSATDFVEAVVSVEKFNLGGERGRGSLINAKGKPRQLLPCCSRDVQL